MPDLTHDEVQKRFTGALDAFLAWYNNGCEEGDKVTVIPSWIEFSVDEHGVLDARDSVQNFDQNPIWDGETWITLKDDATRAKIVYRATALMTALLDWYEEVDSDDLGDTEREAVEATQETAKRLTYVI